MKLTSLCALGLAYGQDLDFEDVFDHTCDATTMYATIRKTDLAQLGTWKDNFDMVTLNEGCPGQLDEYGNVVFSAGRLNTTILNFPTTSQRIQGFEIDFTNHILSINTCDY